MGSAPSAGLVELDLTLGAPNGTFCDRRHKTGQAHGSGRSNKKGVTQITFNAGSGSLVFVRQTAEAPMKRLGYLVVLMALSSSAQAGDTLSFVIGGHRVNIDAPRNCRSASCVSVSIPGIYQTRSMRDRNDDTGVAPAPAAAPVVTPVKPVAAPIVCAPPAPRPPVSPTLAATTTQGVVAPPPRPEPVKTASAETPPVEKTPVADAAIEKAPVEKPPIETPAVAAKPITDAAPVTKVSQRIESDPDSPLGDWQTEGKTGTVRIEQCGKALCGYVLNLASNVQEKVNGNVQDDVQENAETNVKGDAVLINMKLKSDTVWSGNIYSRASGNTYYATMTMKGANTLRVEACALGHFFCSGNDWTRIATPPEKLITSRQVTTAPRS
jgi:uncharacterized protein (DUF2147 family)